MTKQFTTTGVAKMNPRTKARATLSNANIAIGQDFSSLSDDQCAAIIAEAKVVYQAKHGKPMPDDNEAFIRKRYELLQQRARPR
jgi:hypothetical protein